jgi:hypothetical protein
MSVPRPRATSRAGPSFAMAASMEEPLGGRPLIGMSGRSRKPIPLRHAVAWSSVGRSRQAVLVLTE